jgi:leucyl/phenylalanyl-tRNA--protein transferase
MIPVTPENVLKAYRRGIFPSAVSRRGPVEWYAPDPRGILPLDAVHVPRRLARVICARRFAIDADRDFEGVIEGCADRPETWISDEIREAYVELHRRGHAHSVEARYGGRLAGGLYGVHVEGAFMAESMFHRRTDAGKVCLVALTAHLRARGFSLLDIQQVTRATAPFGAIEIPRDEYLRRLRDALRRPASWGWFEIDPRPSA